jgi:uncharacterized membrane protein
VTQSAPPATPPSGQKSEPESGGRNVTGLTSRRAAALVVLSGWVGAIYLYLHEHEDRFVRFYSLQTLAHFGLFLVNCAVAAALANVSDFFGLGLHFPLIVLSILPIFASYWLLMLIAAWQGRIFKLPLVGHWCEIQAGI